MRNIKILRKLRFAKLAQFSKVAQSCLTLCDPMNCSTPGLPVQHQLPEFTQTHVHRVGDAIQPTFSLSSFTFIKRHFSSSSLSAVKVVSSAYLGLLIFLPAILIPACDSSSPPFHMMYSAYKLNKQGDNIQPWHTPFLIWNHITSYINARCGISEWVLTVQSCPTLWDPLDYSLPLSMEFSR